MYHILIVDDDPRIQRMLQRYLESEGYDVSVASDTVSARKLMNKRCVHMILLDLRLGKEDGLHLLQDIRASGPPAGVIILSGKSEIIDRVIGLELGADDYVTKPFHLRELHARIKTVLRRTRETESPKEETPSSRLGFGRWQLDLDSRCLFDQDGCEHSLTSSEYTLLQVLVTHPHKVLNRDQLLDMTAGRTSAPFDRTIDTQVRRLRVKIEDDPAVPQLIKTVRGNGYIFAQTVKRLPQGSV